ncbi:MAG: pantetheine-phosphate adenylyltransferase [Atopostipes suicloacalis]|nr:pantetheine-phosphate adenylyltransferase [Atopostipes suicloacalis]MDN6731763.1 pantetheine-phosphate adenylyltransferase [Atopostipes suicloacalis]
MTKAIYAGSFDPFTLGHLDIVNRAATIFDEVIIAISVNTSKKSLFTADEKVKMISTAIKKHSKKNIRVIQFSDGLIVDLAEKEGAQVLLRGLRSSIDMEYEMNIASANKTQNHSIESMFLMADEKYRFISSSLIKEIAQFQGDLSMMLSPGIAEEVKEKYQIKKGQ